MRLTKWRFEGVSEVAAVVPGRSRSGAGGRGSEGGHGAGSSVGFGQAARTSRNPRVGSYRRCSLQSVRIESLNRETKLANDSATEKARAHAGLRVRRRGSDELTGVPQETCTSTAPIPSRSKR